MRDVMVDLETVSNRKDAAILTIGAIKYDLEGDITKSLAGDPQKPEDILAATDAFYMRVDLESCKALGLRVERGTVEWWMKQADDVKYEAFLHPDRKPVSEVMDAFYFWFSGAERVWSKGESFDIAILSEIYARLGRQPPWKYWNERCVRTAYDWGEIDERALGQRRKHHALFDCWYQVIGVQRAHRNVFGAGYGKDKGTQLLVGADDPHGAVRQRAV